MPTTNTKHIFLGLYGEPGIGKTRFAGTTPGKVLLLRPPVDHTDSILPDDKGRIEEKVIHDWSDMDNEEDRLRAEGGKYDWVWIDSWSLLQDVLLDDLFNAAITRKAARKEFGPDKSEFGINMYRIGAFMRHIIGPDLFNVGFTGHPATLASPDLDEDGDPVEKLMPWIQGRNMSPKLCGYTNLVCFMERAGTKGRRVIRSQSDPRFYAKDQFDALPDGVLWDPTMPKLIDLIEKSPGRAKAGRSTKRPATKRRRTTTRKGSK